jgi:hypothetical protein
LNGFDDADSSIGSDMSMDEGAPTILLDIRLNTY